MLTFKDLIIEANDEQMEKFVEILTNKVSENPLWSRESDRENLILGIEKAYAFQRREHNNFPNVGVSIFPKEEGVSWYVPNVVPLESGQLSIQEYNDILTEFYEQFVKPICQDLRLQIEITSGEVDDIDILGKKAADALSIFSDCANKSTGSAHPNDRRRWFAFINAACKPGRSIDVGLLERLLIEQEWDAESANKLVIEFEFGQDLINYMRENA